MRISRIQQIPFTNYVRIHIKDKTRGNNFPMDKIVGIATENKTTYLVGEDVVLFSSSEELKEDLSIAGIQYEEVSEDEY